MTVQSEVSRVTYVGNGTDVSFPVPFYFLAAADLTVLTVIGDTETPNALGTDYLVTGVGNPAGGGVEFTTAPAFGVKVVILRHPPITQLTDYNDQDPFPADSHERALDKITMILQRLQGDVSRSPKFGQGSSLVDIVFPEPGAGKLIGWNNDGTGLEARPQESALLLSALSALAQVQLIRDQVENSLDQLEGLVNGLETPSVEEFHVSSSTTSITLTIADPVFTFVYVNDGYQRPGEAYTISGATLTPSEPWADGDVVTVVTFAPIALRKQAGTFYSTRTEFLAATIPADAPRTGFITGWRSSALTRDAAGPIVQTGGQRWRPDGDVSPLHFGAVPDWNPATQTGTDNAVAFNAARNWLLSSGRRGRLIIPAGRYLLGSSFDIAGTGIVAEGESGELSTVLVGGMMSGHVVGINNRHCGLKNIEITSTDARKAGGAGSGLRVESQDIAFFRPTHVTVENVTVHDQPGIGGIWIGGVWFNSIQNSSFYRNGTHGLVFDSGHSTGRTFTENPGIVQLDRVGCYENGGHGLLIGGDNNVSNRGFRFDIRNLDLYSNALASGSRKTSDQAWLFMDTSTIEGSAFNGSDTLVDTTIPVTGGIRVAGRDVLITRNRFLAVNNHCVRAQEVLGFTTSGIRVEQPMIFGTTPTSIFHVEPECQNCEMSIGSRINIVSPVNTGSGGKPFAKRVLTVSRTTSQAVNDSTTLVADAELKAPLFARERVQFRFSITYRGPSAGGFKAAVTAPAGATISYCTAGGVRVDTSDNIVIQPAIFAAGTSIVVGTASGSVSRMLEIVGEVITNGTSGELGLQFAQNTATVGDTEILTRSNLVINQH